MKKDFILDVSGKGGPFKHQLQCAGYEFIPAPTSYDALPPIEHVLLNLGEQLLTAVIELQNRVARLEASDD